MRPSPSHLVLARTLAASLAASSAPNPLPAPQFTAAFTGQFNVSARYNTTGPFGVRGHHTMDGGTLSNTTTGEVVADILSFSDNEVLTESGLSFPTLVMPLVWRTDEHFASVSTQGIRNETGPPYSWLYAHVETDSPTYSWMNGKFFIVQIDAPIGSATRSFTLYEEASSSASGSS